MPVLKGILYNGQIQNGDYRVKLFFTIVTGACMY